LTLRISQADQRDLARLLRKCRQSLIDSQEGQIIEMTRGYAKLYEDIDIEDLRQEARLAVFDCTQTYDPDRPKRFAMYARDAIRNHFSNLSKSRKNRALSQFLATDDEAALNETPADQKVPCHRDCEETEYQSLVAELLAQIPFLPREVLIRKDGLLNQTPRNFIVIAREMWLPTNEVRAHYDAAKAALQNTARQSQRRARIAV
jgi:DNA-directed RNA polymerase specialized sigma subunit